jgi:hypothetical protein
VKHWLWRAVDQNGIVLDVLVQRRRDKRAAKRLLRKLLKKQKRPPRVMITDKLASYGAAKRVCNDNYTGGHRSRRRRQRVEKTYCAFECCCVTRRLHDIGIAPRLLCADVLDIVKSAAHVDRELLAGMWGYPKPRALPFHALQPREPSWPGMRRYQTDHA